MVSVGFQRIYYLSSSQIPGFNKNGILQDSRLKKSLREIESRRSIEGGGAPNSADKRVDRRDKILAAALFAAIDRDRRRYRAWIHTGVLVRLFRIILRRVVEVERERDKVGGWISTDRRRAGRGKWRNQLGFAVRKGEEREEKPRS